ncbi:MAG: TfoX/Sxy family protein [Candidatus Sericytochromatia bacterium]|nr:TfoX/Sxy family protein [Candidatus Sericytochromatia bacterium]
MPGDRSLIEIVSQPRPSSTPLSPASVPVNARAMFGGYGVYSEGLIFGLIVADVFYLKVDDGNRAQFVAPGLLPFTYDAKGKQMSMSYHRVPDVTDLGELKPWIDGALAASRRANAAKRRPGHQRGRSKTQARQGLPWSRSLAARKAHGRQAAAAANP